MKEKTLQESYKYDKVFRFLFKETEGKKGLGLNVNEIRKRLNANKSTCNNNLQYLYQRKVINRYKSGKRSLYYTCVGINEYNSIVEQYRNRRKAKDDKLSGFINEFIFCGNKKRITDNLYLFT